MPKSTYTRETLMHFFPTMEILNTQTNARFPLFERINENDTRRLPFSHTIDSIG